MTRFRIGAFFILMAVGALFLTGQYIDRRGYDRAKAEDLIVIEKSKREAAALLTREIQKNQRIGQALLLTKNNQDLKDAEHQKTLNALSDRLRAAGRLRDPHAIGCGAGSGGAAGDASAATGDGAADATQTGRLLSTELSELLRRLQREADIINVAYASCRADAYAIRIEYK